MSDMSITDRVRTVRKLVDQRLTQFPRHPLFLFALGEVNAIERVASRGRMDRAFYEGLSIGLMCARELEPSDRVFCEEVYAMLEGIRMVVSSSAPQCEDSI